MRVHSLLGAWIAVSTSLGCDSLSGLSDFNITGQGGSQPAVGGGGGSGGSGGEGGEGGSGAAPPLPLCPFGSDDFEAPGLGPYWVTNPFQSPYVQVLDGRLALDLPMSATSGFLAVVGMTETFDVCSISLEIVGGNAGVDEQFYFAMGLDLNNTAGFLITGNVLTAGFIDDGTPIPVGGPVPHDPVVPIYLGMRFQGQAVTFMTSPTGEEWTVLGSGVDPNEHDLVPMGFGVSTGGATGGVSFVLDNVNIAAP